jgi:hypothetical protein
MNRSRIAAVAALTAALGLMALAPSAGANHHLMKIRAYFVGPGTGNANSFVQLQTTAAGQNFVNGTQLRVYNAAATLSSNFIINGNVANGADQARILIADTSFVGPRDFTAGGLKVSLEANEAAGALCYIGLGAVGIDCASWGGFTGNANLPSSAGTPESGGLSHNMVSIRPITRGCATAMDEADDTNSTAADFTRGVFPPTTNPLSPVAGEVPCTTPVKKAKKCKKKKGKKHSADAAKKKKCKKKKKKGK